MGSVEGSNVDRSRPQGKHSHSCTSTCHAHTFMQKLRDMCWYGCPVEDRMGADAGKTRSVEKEYERDTGRSKHLGA